MHGNENEMPKNGKIQWHPGFYAAAEIELRLNREQLEFHREYNLSKKPLQIDLLVIEKLKDVQIQNELGKLFRRYNVIEYKSPDDGLTIDDFFKTIGYAYLYKGLGEKVDQIPLEELTVSIFRDTKPEKLMEKLNGYGCVIIEYAPGIYYIEGLMIPVQIIVTGELKGKEHLILRVLSKNAEETDLREFVKYVNNFTEAGEKENVDAVLQVSVSANREIYDQIRRNMTMCEALRELMKDEIEAEVEAARRAAEREGRENGWLEGRAEGRAEGENRLKELCEQLDQDGRRDEVFQAMKNPEILKKLYKEYGIA